MILNNKYAICYFISVLLIIKYKYPFGSKKELQNTEKINFARSLMLKAYCDWQ